MRSLWKVMAARWLGTDASEALTEETVVIELLLRGDRDAAPPVAVRREPAVSYRAMMLRLEHAQAERDADPVVAERRK
jgi:hypothetical protein